MESKIKTSGHNHPGSDNNEKRQKQAPFFWGKDAGVCYPKVILVESAIKTSGHTHPRSDNDGK